MPDNVPASRTRRLIKVRAATDNRSKVDVDPELKELYGQLVEATVAVRDAARIAREKPWSSIGRKILDLDLKIDAIISRINRILGSGRL
jgi:hypothetical protein